MAPIKFLAKIAIQKLASDPELQRRAKRVVKEKILPKAKKGIQNSKPVLNRVKISALTLAENIKNNLK